MAHTQAVTVIGGGLAGCAAALRAAESGVRVILWEQRPGVASELHGSELLGELVGSNLLGPARPDRASGLLRLELRELGCAIVECVEQASLGESHSLIDRSAFARLVTESVAQQAGVEVRREQAQSLPAHGVVVVATGPTTWSPFARGIYRAAGEPFTFAFWGRPPVIRAEGIGDSPAEWLPPYPGADPLLFVPLSEDEVAELAQRISNGERAEPPGLAEAVLADEGEPVEKIIRDDPSRFRRHVLRGPRTNGVFGGDCAALRLRPDGSAGSYHVEGFVTTLTPDAQRHALEAISALAAVSVARPGVVARLPHLPGPKALLPTLQMKRAPGALVAGLLGGAAGYWEALATGCVAGINAARLARGEQPVVPPSETMTGALCSALTRQAAEEPGLMAAGFGLLPDNRETKGLSKSDRRAHQAETAEAAVRKFAADLE